jgi:hypothetical protein
MQDQQRGTICVLTHRLRIFFCRDSPPVWIPLRAVLRFLAGHSVAPQKNRFDTASGAVVIYPPTLPLRHLTIPPPPMLTGRANNSNMDNPVGTREAMLPPIYIGTVTNPPTEKISTVPLNFTQNGYQQPSYNSTFGRACFWSFV